MYLNEELLLGVGFVKENNKYILIIKNKTLSLENVENEHIPLYSGYFVGDKTSIRINTLSDLINAIARKFYQQGKSDKLSELKDALEL